MFGKSKKLISLVMLVTMIMVVLPPTWSALTASAGADGRILTTNQTGNEDNSEKVRNALPRGNRQYE